MVFNQGRNMKNLLIITILACSLFSEEVKFTQVTGLSTEMKPIEIELRIVLNENSVPDQEIAMYFKVGNYFYAFYLDVEQRQQLVETYNKFQKWKQVAYDNKVSHSKEIETIKKVKSYFKIGSTGDWHAANKCNIILKAAVGEFNLLAFNIPKLSSISNEYMDADAVDLIFAEKSEMMDEATNEDLERLGGSSAKEFIYNNMEESNFLKITNGLLKDADKKKNVDLLFD